MKEKMYLATWPVGASSLKAVSWSGPVGRGFSCVYSYRSDDVYSSREEAEFRLAAEGLSVGKKTRDPRVVGTFDFGQFPCWEVMEASGR